MAATIGSLLDPALAGGVGLLDDGMAALQGGARMADQAASPLERLLATPSPLATLASGLDSTLSGISLIDRFRPGVKPQATPDGKDTTTPQDAYRIESGDPLSQIIAKTRPTVDTLAKISTIADADQVSTGRLIKLPSGHAAAAISRPHAPEVGGPPSR